MKKKPTKQQVAEICYRDASNYKLAFTFLIPKGLKIKVGDDVDVCKFGISDDEWFNEILPNRGFMYSEEEDHTSVEIGKIRDRADDDMPTNEDCVHGEIIDKKLK